MKRNLWSRILSLFTAIVLVLSVFPGMQLFAGATDERAGLEFSDDYLRTDKPLVGSPDTLEFWVNVPSDINTSVYLLGDYLSQGTSAENISFEIHNGGNKLTFYWNSKQMYNGECVFPKDTWTHVAVVRNADTGEFTLYFNGEVKLTFTNTASALTGTKPITMGNYTTGGANRQFNGMLADVRIWGESRTQEQIKADMDNKVIGTEENLLAAWRLDKAAGILAYRDYSPNKNHAYFEGGDPSTVVEEPDPTEPPATEPERTGVTMSTEMLKTDKVIPGSPDTISFWIKLPSGTLPERMHVIGDYHHNNNGKDSLAIDIYGGGNNLRLYWNGAYVWQSGFPMERDVWNHVAFVRDPETGVFTVYKNGEVYATTAKTGAAMSGTVNPIGIGGDWRGTPLVLQGCLSDLQMWSISMTQAEIQAGMNTTPVGNEAGLLANWKFDEAEGSLVFRDYSANKNHAYFNGGDPDSIVDEPQPTNPPATEPEPTEPEIDGVQFSDDYLRTDKPIVGSPDTLEFWIYVPADMVASTYLLGDYMSQGSSFEDLSFEIHNNGNKLTVYWNGPAVYNGECVFPKDTWTHVALVRAADGTFTLYFNGEVKLVFSKTSGAIEGTRPITMGNYTGGGANRQFNGMLADIRIWKESRTAEQIKSDMTTAPAGDEANLLAWWKLDEADGALTFKDHSTNKNHAYFEGGDPDSIVDEPQPTDPPATEPEPTLPEINGVQFSDDFMRTDDVLPGSPDTVSFWVKIPEGNMPSRMLIISDYNPALAAKSSIVVDIWGNGAYMKIYWNEVPVWSGAYPFAREEWGHFAFVRDAATGKFTIYKNGEVFGNSGDKTGATMTTTKNPIGIGGDWRNGHLVLQGCLSDLRIWSVSMTQEQIEESMTNELTGNEEGLLAWWKLDETDGALTFKDHSTNKNHAYFEGGDPDSIDPPPAEPEPTDPPATEPEPTLPEINGVQFSDDYLRTDKPIVGSPDTLEFWIYVPADMVASTYLLGDYMSQGNSFEDLSFEIHNNGNKLTVYWNGPAVYNGECVFPKDTWTHVALVRAADGTFTLYFNGEVKLVFDKTSGAIEGTRPITMGNYTNGGANRQFNGMLADIRIWKESRTAEQIKSDMTTAPAGDEANLLAWWKLDEADGALTFKDHSTNKNHAYFEGGDPDSIVDEPQPTDPPATEPEPTLPEINGVQFSDDYLRTDKPIVGSPDTLEFWIYIPADMVASTYLLGDYMSQGSSFEDLSFEIHNNGNKLTVYWNGPAVYNGECVFPKDTWTHVALVRAADGTFTLYFNGEVKLVFDKTSGAIEGTRPITMGNYTNGGANRQFNGMLADVRIWKESRTQEQIKSDMTTAPAGDEANLLAWWKLDEADGALTFKDYSHNKNHAYFEGGDPDSIDPPEPTEPVPTEPADPEADRVGVSMSDEMLKTDKVIPGSPDTISFWVKLPSGTLPERMHVIGDYNHNGNGKDSLAIDIYGGGNNLRLYWNGAYVWQGGFGFQRDVWTHVAFVRNPETGVFTIYKNGEVYATSAKTGAAMSGTTNPIGIGGDWRMPPLILQGCLSDLQMWSVSMTQAEIQAGMKTTPVGNETGLLANWKFNEEAGAKRFKDSSSNANHAYFEGGNEQTPDHLVGVEFDETRLNTDKVIPGSPDTIEVWVKVPKDVKTERMHIFGDYDYNGNGVDSIALDIYATGKALRLYWNGAYIWQGGYNFATDEWTHIAIVRNPDTGVFTIYINGNILVVTEKTGAALNGTANPIGIGGDWRAAPCFFEGMIADLRFWSTSRTQAQIKEDMFNTLTGNEADLLANWKLDEGADATEFKDCSPNGIHAKLESWSSGDQPEIGDIEFTTDHLVGHKFDGESYFATNIPVGDVVNSFEFWMQVPADVVADRMHVFGDWQYKGNQFESVSVDIYSDGNAFRLAWNNAYLMQGGVSVKGGDWVHVAVSRNTETGYIYLYINGEMVMRTYQVSEAITAINPIAIGSDWRAGAHFFKGTVADLRFWSDTRTQKEIVDNMSHYLNGDEEGLLANWKFDHMINNSIYKDSGSKDIDAVLKRTWFQQEDPTGDYSIVIIPDTQHYACYDYPEMHEQMMQWLVDNAEKENIQFALHVGDFTNCDAAYEWERARKAMSILDGVIPYYMVVGNHDYPLISAIRDAGLYNRFFPYSKFSQWETFGGAFEEGLMDNVYYYEEMGGVDYLIICLEFGPRAEVIAWADELVTNHPNHKVILVTHSYLCGDGTHASKDTDCVCEGSSYGYANLEGASVTDGDEMWEQFVSKHDNILFTFNGHDDGMYCRVDQGINGNNVYQFLVDSQSTGTGGDGLMCIIRFRADGTVTSSYYSPLKDQYYMTDCQIELDLSKELITDIADNYNARMEALPENAADLTLEQAKEVVALIEGMKTLTDNQKALLKAELIAKTEALESAARELVGNEPAAPTTGDRMSALVFAAMLMSAAGAAWVCIRKRRSF